VEQNPPPHVGGYMVEAKVRAGTELKSQFFAAGLERCGK
jgi:hypothetical protein